MFISKKAWVAFAMFSCSSLTINVFFLVKKYGNKKTIENQDVTVGGLETLNTYLRKKSENLESVTKNGSVLHKNSGMENDYSESAGKAPGRLELVIQKRRDLVRQACKTTKESLTNAPYIFVNEKLKVVYCLVAKVASTSWSTAVLTVQMGHPPENMEVLQRWETQAKRYRLTSYPQDVRKKILADPEYFKFMFVRDPLDRVISAWEDKFNRTKEYYSQTYGRNIIRKYRKDPSNEALRTGNNVSFEEMVRYVSDIPNIKNADEHWRPLADTCFPCSVDYDMYGNFYNMDEESQYVFKNLKGAKIIDFPSENTGHEEKKRTYDHSRTVERNKLNKLYSRISNEQMRKFQNQYKIDYNLFSAALHWRKVVKG